MIIFILQFFLFAFILSALVHQNLTHVSFIQSIRSFFQPTIPSIPQKEQVIVNMHKQSITNDEEISKEHELLQQSLTNENPFAIRIMGLSYSYQTTKKNVNQIQPSCTVLNK